VGPERRGTIAFLVLAAVAMAIAVLLGEGAEGPRCVRTAVDVYPRGRAMPLPADADVLLRAVSALDLTPPLVSVEALRVPPEAWLGQGGGVDVFGHYAETMIAVPFDRMGPELRELLGLPVTGPVDSPPLLYSKGGAALLIRPAPDGSLTLLVMRCRG